MRRIKRVSILCLVVALGIIMTACTKKEENKYANKGELQFTAPEDWVDNGSSNQFDMSWTSPNNDASTRIVKYLKNDLDEDQTPEDMFQLQVKNDTVQADDRKVTPVEENTVEEKNGLKINRTVYSGKSGDKDIYIITSLVQFDGNETQFVIVHQIAHKENWAKQEKVLKNIVESGKLV